MNGFETCLECGKLVATGTVTLENAEYQELMRKATLYEKSQVAAAGFRRWSNSPISRHPQLAAFISDNSNSMTLAEMIAGIGERFPDLVPSKSALHRYLSALKRPLEVPLKHGKTRPRRPNTG